jgi:hypothetical protein
MFDLIDGPERQSCTTCGRTMDVIVGGRSQSRVDGCARANDCGLAAAGRYVVVSEAPARRFAKAPATLAAYSS